MANKKITESQLAFLETLEDLCEKELSYCWGSMSEVEHDIALKQKMKSLAVKLHEMLGRKPA